MSFFGICIIFVILVSFYFGYKIYCKLVLKQKQNEKKGILDKILILLITNLIIVSINLLVFSLSYSYIWEKVFRAYSEPIYEAIVVGYKKEIIKNQNFRGGAFYNKTVFFPKVKFKNEKGQEIIKTLDLTSNQPIPIGEKISITDSSENSVNTINLNWILLFFLSVFSGVGVFFSLFLITYCTDFNTKKRVHYSFKFAALMILTNMLCLILLYMKV